ncbi:MAG: hypothetical protein ABFD45_08420 [Smithella sp.]
MKIESIGIQATIEKAQLLVRDDKQLSAATKSMFEILIRIICPFASLRKPSLMISLNTYAAYRVCSLFSVMKTYPSRSLKYSFADSQQTQAMSLSNGFLSPL